LDLKLNFEKLPVSIQKQLVDYADFLVPKYKKIRRNQIFNLIGKVE
jgi:hypothetical protein